ncbi:response regulator [Streptomyces sp. PRB2-1]|uniref:Response regulator n=1 Tax=Actinacidiphila epipremni TaxID=2053013 RepID=A0ABX0ZR20_9ACTN|nr:response regulator [Actinacidiphila epipremni]
MLGAVPEDAAAPAWPRHRTWTAVAVVAGRRCCVFSFGRAGRYGVQTPRSTAVNSLLPQRAYHVLLVEDDAADALLIEEALTDRGIARAIGRADDGVEALEYLRDASNPRPDLIVLDLNMPRMNGRELLGVLKQDAELRSIPVVVLTTSSTPDDVSAAYQRHANAYVTKPVNLDDFLESVRSIDQFFLETATVPLQED